MGQCYGREAATSDGSDSWKNTAGKRRSTGGIYALHSNCISNGTKNTLSFARHQRGKLYILRRCVTMLLLWHKHSLNGKVGEVAGQWECVIFSVHRLKFDDMKRNLERCKKRLVGKAKRCRRPCRIVFDTGGKLLLV